MAVKTERERDHASVIGMMTTTRQNLIIFVSVISIVSIISMVYHEVADALPELSKAAQESLRVDACDHSEKS